MKAEQRKELETNALADRMGHLVQRVKTQQRRTTLYYVLGAGLIVLTTLLIVQWFRVSREQESERWRFFDIGTQSFLLELAKKEADSNAGKAARFQFAWWIFWEEGVKRLGLDGPNAMQRIDVAAGLYKDLAKECTGDKVWEPEALYALAVIEETHAVVNGDRLESAKKLYEDLSKSHPDSARGQLAKDWVANYEDKEKREKLTDFYQQMHTVLSIPDPELLRKNQDLKNLLQPKKEKKGK